MGVSFQTTTIRPTRRKDPPDKRLESVRQTLAEILPAEYTFYTDGSATDGVKNGGARVIFRGEMRLKRVLTTVGHWTSSYRAEMTMLDSTLKFLQGTAAGNAPNEVQIYTDSQSALGRIPGGTDGPPGRQGLATTARTRGPWNPSDPLVGPRPRRPPRQRAGRREKHRGFDDGRLPSQRGQGGSRTAAGRLATGGCQTSVH